MPSISVTWVNRREPSFSRCWCTMSWMAEEICSRIERGDSSIPAIIVIVSSRESESRGELEWMVEIEPS